jgi:hypothetical protein
MGTLWFPASWMGTVNTRAAAWFGASKRMKAAFLLFCFSLRGENLNQGY